MANKVTTTVLTEEEVTAPAAVHPAEETTTKETTTEEATTTTEEPFYQATGRTLDSADDAKKYIQELEEKQLNQVPPSVETTPKEQTQSRPEYLADLQFSDPVKYQSEIQNDFDLRQEQKEVQKTALNNFYADFYSNNEDLKGHEYVVKLVQTDKMSELKNLSPQQASKELAKHVRAAIKSRTTGDVEEVAANETTVLSSGTDTETKKTTEKPATFTEQLMALREGKG